MSKITFDVPLGSHFSHTNENLKWRDGLLGAGTRCQPWRREPHVNQSPGTNTVKESANFNSCPLTLLHSRAHTDASTSYTLWSNTTYCRWFSTQLIVIPSAHFTERDQASINRAFVPWNPNCQSREVEDYKKIRSNSIVEQSHVSSMTTRWR